MAWPLAAIGVGQNKVQQHQLSNDARQRTEVNLQSRQGMLSVHMLYFTRFGLEAYMPEHNVLLECASGRGRAAELHDRCMSIIAQT